MICCKCPHNCSLEEGEIGRCGVRKNVGGENSLLWEGRVSCAAIEPIEKRPFFHFFPGSKFLSVGFFGCPYECPWCLNSDISQLSGDPPEPDFHYTPKELNTLTRQRSVQGIVFTYNEPTLYSSYILEVVPQLGRKVAIKSNGFVNEDILIQLCEEVDAWNIDIKGSEHLDRVLKSIALVYQQSHLEVSYFVAPEHVGNLVLHRLISRRLQEISPKIPVHLLYCYPSYLQSESYERTELLPIFNILAERMEFVYISNIYGSCQRTQTVCPSCNAVLIDRYPVRVNALSCCGKTLPGIFS